MDTKKYTLIHLHLGFENTSLTIICVPKLFLKLFTFMTINIISSEFKTNKGKNVKNNELSS